MFANLRGTPAAPPTFGLVASAVRPDPPPHWERGLSWIPERCGVDYQIVPFCADAGAYDYPKPGAAYYRPYAIRFADRVTTMQGVADTGRVRRMAEAQTSFAVARELWTGAASAADTYPLPVTGATASNAALAPGSTVVGGSAASVEVGLGRLEQAALEASGGQQIHMHIPIVLLPQMQSYLVKVADTLFTQAGNVVIADGGYPGTGPTGQPVGATAWAYATAPVAVLLSPIDIEDDDPAVVDHATNTRTVWAARSAAAFFDPCVHLATQITL